MNLVFYRKLEKTADMLVRAASGRRAGSCQAQSCEAAPAQAQSKSLPCRRGELPHPPAAPTQQPPPSSPQLNQEKGKSHVLTCHSQRGGALVPAMLIGYSAGVLATVFFDWLQNLQAGSSRAANDGVLVALVDLVSIFKPGEAHFRSVLHLTFKLDSVANVCLHGDDSAPEHGRPCVRGRDDKTDGVGKGKDGGV